MLGHSSGYKERGRFLQSGGDRWERRGCQHLRVTGWRWDVTLSPENRMYSCVAQIGTNGPFIMKVRRLKCLFYLVLSIQLPTSNLRLICIFIYRVWPASPAAEQTVRWVIPRWKPYLCEMYRRLVVFTAGVLCWHGDNTTESHVNYLWCVCAVPEY